MIAAAPDIVIGSWCGKKFVPAKFAARPGFDAIPAVRDGFLREIKSTLILQPGPAALTDGLDALEGIVAEWARPPAPLEARIPARRMWYMGVFHNGTRCDDSLHDGPNMKQQFEARPRSAPTCCWCCS